MIVLQQNGLEKGGTNFDAKVRRGSNDPMDLFYAHIGGMDTFARALLVAHAIIEDKAVSNIIAERYRSFDSGIGARMMSGQVGLEEIERWVSEKGHPSLQSGRQEMLENLIHSYLS
jgi:xylose isomerase